MIGIDANILVRYLTQDDLEQSRRANDFIEATLTQDSPGFVNHIVLVELIWVLESCYNVGKPQIIDIIQRMIGVRQLRLQEPEEVARSLRFYETNNIDFADALIATINQSQGCETTLTLDRKTAKTERFRSI